MATEDSNALLIDSHCHLDLDQFDADREEVVERARAAEIGFIVDPGIDLVHSRQAIALAETYPEVYAAVGVHPTSSAQFDSHTVTELRTLAAHAKVVAIGEIGLDYYWDAVAPEQQKVALRAQLALAAEVGLPVIIHSRDSNDDMAEELSRWVQSEEFRASALAARPYAGVLHAFSGDAAMARAAYEWGFVISLGGPVTYKNAQALRELLPSLRRDRLMLETDAPYLSPHPYRSRRNEPAYVRLVCERLAEIYEVEVDDIAAESSTVAVRFFGLESASGGQNDIVARANPEG